MSYPIELINFFGKIGVMVDFLSLKVGIKSDIFKVAGWLHDIGNIIDNDNYAKHSMMVLEERGVKVNNVLKDCILNHGAKSDAKTKEGKIFPGSR